LTSRHLPPPVTVADCYAAAILNALDGLNTVLGDIRDRIPQAQSEPADFTVIVAEPAPDDSDAKAVPVAEPAPSRVPRKQAPTPPRRNGRGR
jgi:hypothetical protein